MNERERASPTLIESGLKNLIGGRDNNYPLISGINGKYINPLYRFCVTKITSTSAQFTSSGTTLRNYQSM